jgi:hypothetical protein
MKWVDARVDEGAFVKASKVVGSLIQIPALTTYGVIVVAHSPQTNGWDWLIGKFVYSIDSDFLLQLQLDTKCKTSRYLCWLFHHYIQQNLGWIVEHNEGDSDSFFPTVYALWESLFPNMIKNAEDDCTRGHSGGATNNARARGSTKTLNPTLEVPLVWKQPSPPLEAPQI